MTGSGGPPARPRVSLTVTYRPHGSYPQSGQTGPALRWTLTCSPVGGSHPARAAACRELTQHARELWAVRIQCLVIVRGAPSATVTGFVGARRIAFATGGCSPAWHTLRALLTGSS